MTYYMLLDTSKSLSSNSISNQKGFPDIVMITDNQWDIYDFMLGEGADTYEIEEYNYDMVKYINSEYNDFPYYLLRVNLPY